MNKIQKVVLGTMVAFLSGILLFTKSSSGYPDFENIIIWSIPVILIGGFLILILKDKKLVDKCSVSSITSGKSAKGMVVRILKRVILVVVILAALSALGFFLVKIIQEQQKHKKYERYGRDGALMVFVPYGSFDMGSSYGENNKNDNESPQHTAFPPPYYIDKYEVTNDQFKKFVDATNYITDAEKGNGGWVLGEDPPQKKSASWKDPAGNGQGILDKMNHPVVQVSWNDAVAYANYYGKRLPTEEEWERACRAGSTTKYSFGNAEMDLGDYAWYEANSNNQTHPVGTKKPNAFGLYDMPGNVMEWCSDRFDYYYGHPNYPINLSGKQGRVLRGSPFCGNASLCRSTIRFSYLPSDSMNIVGFRCASSP